MIFASFSFFFFFNDTATTEIYTLSLHDALPICGLLQLGRRHGIALLDGGQRDPGASLEVEAEPRLPVPAQGRQTVEHSDHQPEDEQGACGAGRLLRHGDVSPSPRPWGRPRGHPGAPARRSPPG